MPALCNSVKISQVSFVMRSILVGRRTHSFRPSLAFEVPLRDISLFMAMSLPTVPNHDAPV